MRLWTIHPKYLDAAGLVSLWREGLLAQAVLRGRTKGYVRHPQLLRFRRSAAPVRAIAAYLRAVHAEASRRGYDFDEGKIARAGPSEPLTVARGQLEHEWRHLLAKLRKRDMRLFAQRETIWKVKPHPLFRVIPGGVEDCEKL